MSDNVSRLKVIELLSARMKEVMGNGQDDPEYLPIAESICFHLMELRILVQRLDVAA